MTICYRCENKLPVKNPPEHIIHNSLGGRLKSRRLLCNECNGIYGKSIDLELRNNAILPTLLNIEIDRGSVKKSIKGIEEKSKTEYEISNNRDQKLLDRKPEVNEMGRKVYFVNNESHAKKMASRILKSDNEEDVKKKISEVHWSSAEDGVIKFESNLIRTKSATKAIAKIAINFFIYSEGKRNRIEEIIDYIEPNSEMKNQFVTHFQKDENWIFKIEKDEISHGLYIKGNSELGALFCYIELFNTHCFLVKLKQPYNGENIENQYFYEVRNKVELEKVIDYQITNKDIVDLKFSRFHNNDSCEKFNRKLERIMSLNGDDIKTYKQEKNGGNIKRVTPNE